MAQVEYLGSASIAFISLTSDNVAGMDNTSRFALKLSFGSLCLLFATGPLYAQLSAGITPNPAQATVELSSEIAQRITGDSSSGPIKLAPEVNPDRTVTFHFLAPHASTVQVMLEGQPAPLNMTRDQKGVWTATSPSLAPEIYGYHYIVDGGHLLDPANRWIKTNLLYQDNMFEVRGDAPEPWDQTDIPHGEVEHHFYHSAVVGDDRDYFVYTPPDYNPTAKKKYPVLYLLHGYSDGAEGWTAVGRANFILDSLIAQHKAAPMIVVMSYGYGVPDILKSNGAAFRSPDLIGRNYSLFTRALIEEVMPRVQHEYRTLTGPDQTAIAGLSMGGAESLLTGLGHPEVFGYVIGMSSAPILEHTDFFSAHLKSGGGEKRRLLWVACGEQDGLAEANHKLEDWFKEQGVPATFHWTPGRHTWMVWRDDLVDFAPLLFQKK